MFYSLPPVTRGLIVANVAVFLLELAVGPGVLITYLGLWPLATMSLTGGGVGFQPWQLVTYSFLHGGWLHLFVNMFALYMFGGIIERTFGPYRFLFYYFVCVITAALAHLLVVRFITGDFYPTIGASGGIFGILLAFGMLFPRERIYFWFALPMPAWVFVAGYGVLELVLGVTGTASGIAHFAHLGGMLGGIVLILYWRGMLPLKPRRPLLR